MAKKMTLAERDERERCEHIALDHRLNKIEGQIAKLEAKDDCFCPVQRLTLRGRLERLERQSAEDGRCIERAVGDLANRGNAVSRQSIDAANLKELLVPRTFWQRLRWLVTGR